MTRSNVALVTICACLIITGAPNLRSDAAEPCSLALPFRVPEREPVDRSQRTGKTVAIRATRTITLTTGRTHQSTNNVVACYIGLPVVDAGQDNVIIEDVHASRAEPSNMAISQDGGTLWVEYVDVPSGFQDEIRVTFTLEIYERRAVQKDIKTYNTESEAFKRYTSPPFYQGVKPERDSDKWFKYLYEAGVSPDMDPISRARTIYDYLHRELAYGRPCRILDGNKPSCATYAALFFIYCQKAGIPARRCAGFVLGPSPDGGPGTTVSGHNWAEFYAEGPGWVPVDPTLGDKTDSRKQYYFGGLDNGHLCVSKTHFSNRLPLRYKKPKDGTLIFTEDAAESKVFKYPQAIQGMHIFKYAYDRNPIEISTSDTYGSSLRVTSRQGEFVKAVAEQSSEQQGGGYSPPAARSAQPTP